MSAEIRELLVQGQEIEERVGSVIWNRYCRGIFDFFPTPELVEVCKKEVDVLSRSYPEPGTGALSEENFEKFKAAAGIAERFALVDSPTGKAVETEPGVKVLVRETALVVSGEFGSPRERLVICGGHLLRASARGHDVYSLSPGDLLANGGNIPGILKGIEDLKILTTRAQELFPVNPKG